MNEINVRIRHADETDSVPLCTWDGTKLADLISEISQWGIYRESNGLMSDDLTGQFVLAQSGAYFEIIVALGDVS